MGNLNDYFALSPRNDLDVRKDDLDKKSKDTKQINYDHYQKKLKWALTNSNRKNIKNIAVTGYYGSGKSSILKTFIKRHDEKTLDDRKLKFLELSLATFNNKKNGQENNDTDQIEKSLLQQIFYKVKDQDIPYSKFKKTGYGKPFFNQWHLSFLTGFIILLFVRLYLYFFDIDYLDPYVYNAIDGLAFGMLSLFIITKIDSLNRFGFKKLSYLNIDLEISKADGENDLSVLSRFLNEIIYFFKQTQFNVVLIEDIDRFDNTEIFSNLRELNFILNSSDLIDDDIIFIYAIKNEQFNSATDRTKFFDFIIPVIPVVNYETSASFFIDKMKASHIDINELMVKRLFMLVDDVRVINNTYNELITYKRILGKEGIDENNNQEQFYGESLVNKLFPLLFYKNAEPKDFSKLLKENGLLYETLNKVDEIKQKKIKCIEEEIDEKEKEIEKIKESPFNTYNELEQHILFKIFKIIKVKHNDRRPVEIEIRVENSHYNLSQVEAIDIDKIIKTGRINFKIQNSFHSLELETIEDELGYTIKERLDNYKKRTPIENINQSKASHLKELNDIKDTPPHRLISFSELKNIHKERKDKSNEGCYSTSQLKIIETLIINGYVDKDYFIYLSDYSDLGISRNDFDFLLRVRDQSITKFDLDIHTPDEINYRLQPSDYNSPAILNFDYANFLFKNKGKILDEDRILFCKQLAKLDVLEVDFLIAYIDTDNCTGVDKFIKTLSETQPNLWYNIRNEKRFNDDVQKKYFIALIKYASVQNIKVQAENSDLIAYLYEQGDFLSITYSSRLKDIINALELKLNKIDFNSDKDLLDFIYENDAYLINQDNIYQFYKHKIGKNNPNLERKALTEIIHNKDQLEKMHQYIFSDNNLYPFINNLILDVPSNRNEEHSTVLGILNNVEEVVPFSLKLKFIESQDSVVENIENVKDVALIMELLLMDKVEYRWQNLFFLKDISPTGDITTEQLENSIKQYQENACTSLLEELEQLNEDDRNKAIHSYVVSNSLKDNIYRYFVSNCISKYGLSSEKFKSFDQLSEFKTQVLVDENFLRLTYENIEGILYSFGDKMACLLFEKNQDQIPEKIDEIKPLITLSLSLKLFDSNIAQIHKTCILNKKFDEFRSYEEFNDAVIKMIIHFKGEGIQANIKTAFKTTPLSEEKVPYFFMAVCNDYNLQDIKTFFQNQKGDYTKLSQHRRRPSFSKDNIHQEMLRELEKKEIIKGFDAIQKRYKAKYVNNY